VSTVDVPKDADGNDVPVLGLYEHPESGAQVYAHTPADEVQYQAEGWKLVKPAKTEKPDKPAAKEASGAGR
jgi:hypothetical protein